MNAPTPADDDFDPMEVEEYLEKDLVEAKMVRIPNCDFPHAEPTLAAYDGGTIQGPWAYMCETHFKAFGIGLGTGKGQRLTLIKGR